MYTILPKNYSDDFKQVLSQPYNEYREDLPIVKYNNCFITHSGIGLKGFKLIEETLFENIPEKYRKHFYKYALFKYFLGKKLRLKRKNFLLIHNHWSKGYHHWVMECLGKILHIDTSQYTLLMPNDYGKFAFDGIALFDFKEVIRIPHNCGMKLDSVSIIANPNSGHYSSSFLSTYRQQLIDKCSTKCIIESSPEYIYVSRKNDRLRHIENEDEVINLVSNYGFKVIDISTLDFYQQVMVFSKCKAYITIHGAALTNAMFMPKGAKVLELYRAINKVNSWMNTCYWNLATASGLDYYYQFCEHGKCFDTSIDNTNIIVDVPTLEMNIKLMLEG